MRQKFRNWTVPKDAWVREVLNHPTSYHRTADLLEDLVMRAETGHLEAGHCSRVAGLAKLIALQVEPDLAEIAYRGGLLHDVGKTLLPFHPARIGRRLNDAERTIVRRHPRLGAEVAAWAGETSEVVGAVYAHHERIDGNGYPLGLSGTQVPLAAQIVAAADVLEALASRRSYKDAWSHRQIEGYLDLRRSGWLNDRVWKAAMAAIPDILAISTD